MLYAYKRVVCPSWPTHLAYHTFCFSKACPGFSQACMKTKHTVRVHNKHRAHTLVIIIHNSCQKLSSGWVSIRITRFYNQTMRVLTGCIRRLLLEGKLRPSCQFRLLHFASVHAGHTLLHEVATQWSVHLSPTRSFRVACSLALDNSNICFSLEVSCGEAFVSFPASSQAKKFMAHFRTRKYDVDTKN